MVTVNVQSLRTFTENAFQMVGVSREDAVLISDALIEADLRGVHSHGVQNLPRWARGFQKGELTKSVTCPIIVDTGSVCLIDGEHGLGVISSNKAMELAIERAAEHGIAIVGVKNSSHFGTAAYFTMKALSRDQIGFCTTNGPAVMAPWGGREPLLCNNPFSYAIPAAEELPIVLDMACSASARGRIRLWARDNRPIPEGWAINNLGEPTTDAREAMEGSLLPFGEYKGYGIAVINEILAAVLTGALFSFDISMGTRVASTEINSDVQTAWSCGHLMGAINISRLAKVDEFKQRIDTLIRRLRSAPKAQGFERVYLPGEIEHELKAERLQHGIPLAESTIQLLDCFAREEIGIDPLHVSDLGQ